MEAYINFLKSLKPKAVRRDGTCFMFKNEVEQYIHIDIWKEGADVFIWIGEDGGKNRNVIHEFFLPSLDFLKDVISNLTFVRNNFPGLLEENIQDR